MTIAAGARLGPYEILSALGAGGMGEVYRARDTRLDRIVAIKVLPDHLAANTELRQRFEREARAVSSLNHPHICTLYDIGHQDGLDYLVMELIEGESLADRLIKGESEASSNNPVERRAQLVRGVEALNRGGRHLVEGVTLREKTHHERIELGKLLRYLHHPAEGLAKAHLGGYRASRSEARQHHDLARRSREDSGFRACATR